MVESSLTSVDIEDWGCEQCDESEVGKQGRQGRQGRQGERKKLSIFLTI
ncbi:MAG: hypothetical protein ACRAVC_08615 [Trichormus sp.]